MAKTRTRLIETRWVIMGAFMLLVLGAGWGITFLIVNTFTPGPNEPGPPEIPVTAGAPDDEPEPAKLPELPPTTAPKQPDTFPEFDTIRTLANSYVRSRMYTDALRTWERFLWRYEERILDLDPKLIRTILDESNDAIEELKLKIRKKQEELARKLRIEDERNKQAIAEQWEYFEEKLSGSGRTVAAVEFVRDHVASLTAENRTRAIEAVLPILNHLILAYFTLAQEIRPTGEATQDSIQLDNGGVLEGQIVEETLEDVRLKLPNGGTLTFRRGQIKSITYGDYDVRAGDLTEARRLMHEALVVAYTQRIRDRIHSGIALMGEGPIPEVEIGSPCPDCDLRGFIECGTCGGSGVVEEDCPLGGPSMGTTRSKCRVCKNTGKVRHARAGLVVLEPLVYKGSKCRNCSGDGIVKRRRTIPEVVEIRRPCTVCDGRGRKYTSSRPVKLKLFACDKNGYSLHAPGRKKRCRSIYAKLRRDLAQWSRRYDGRRLIYNGEYLKIYSEVEFQKTVQDMGLLIEEYAICNKGIVPCTNRIHSLTCKQCQAGIIQATCPECDGAGGTSCRRCAGVGTTLEALDLVAGHPSTPKYEKQILQELK